MSKQSQIVEVGLCPYSSLLYWLETWKKQYPCSKEYSQHPDLRLSPYKDNWDSWGKWTVLGWVRRHTRGARHIYEPGRRGIWKGEFHVDWSLSVGTKSRRKSSQLRGVLKHCVCWKSSQRHVEMRANKTAVKPVSGVWIHVERPLNTPQMGRRDSSQVGTDKPAGCLSS